MGFGGEIVVDTTNPALAAEVRRIGGAHIGAAIEHVELAPSQLSRRMDGLLGKMVYRDNLAFFRSLDVLVVAEKTSLILKKRYGLANLGMIHTHHGAGDRAIGFNRASACFDHVLCSGPKIRDRLIREAGMDASAITIVGYPKFDLAHQTPPMRFLPTAAQAVLYNPHPCRICLRGIVTGTACSSSFRGAASMAFCSRRT